MFGFYRGFPFGMGLNPGLLGARAAWKAQQAAWKMQRKTWKTRQKLARAQARIHHHGPLGRLFGMFWGLFWILVGLGFAFGGPEARSAMMDVARGIGAAVGTAARDLASALGAVQ